MPNRPIPKGFPRAPFERRFYGFLIDFVLLWLCSSFTGGGWPQAIAFAIFWLMGRVVVMDKNQGQSLGYWCMDLKVLDRRYRKIPDIFTLAKREGIVGLESLLAMIGLNIFFINPFTTLLFVLPLLIDCAIAYADEDYNQTFHDRIADTVIIQSRRGFSLDLKTRQLLDEIRYRMRR